MAEKPRQYIFSEEQTRMFFIATGVLMIATILGILLLASSRPQGRFVNLDRTTYLNTLNEASALLEHYQQNPDGSISIPIERAMELVAERGVINLFAEAASSDTAEGSTEATAQDSSSADGEAVFTANCSACHQANGQGIPGVFPPLAGHAPRLYNADRDYLAKLMLYGLQGEIVIDSAKYNGVMPSWKQLTDAELAAALNYVLSSWGNDAMLTDFAPYSSEDIISHRADELTAENIYELRQELDLPEP